MRAALLHWSNPGREPDSVAAVRAFTQKREQLILFCYVQMLRRKTYVLS